MPQNRLSVCMIVKNESSNLPVAIESIRAVADEIVVVDTGSTDDTREVATKLGARVVEYPWDGSFSSARNRAIDEARLEWILFLDADETLDPDSCQEISKAIQQDADAYWVSIESPVRAKAGKVFVNAFPRLFRKLEGVRFEGRVHEQILPSLQRLGAKIRGSKIRIRHSGYDLSKDQLEAKLRRNLDLLHAEIEANPSNVTALFHMGETQSLLGNYQEAVRYYRLALSGEDLPAEAKAVCHQNLASALIKLQQYGEALNQVRMAEGLNPDLLTTRLVKASALFGLKRYDDAEQEIFDYVRDAQKRKRAAIFRLDFNPDIASALVLIAKCRLAKGDWKGAESALSEALKLDRNAEASVLLGRICFERMQFSKAVVHFKDAVEMVGDDEELYFELAKAYVACGALEQGIKVMEEAKNSIQVSASFLKCLGLLRIKARDLEGAIQELEEALKIDPQDDDARRKLAGLYHRVGKTSQAVALLSE